MNQMNGTTNDRIKLNLDHLYCHPIENNYITAQQTTNNSIANQTTNNGNSNNNNSNGNHGTDIFKIFSENKQLKSMLLLHLDLIQEQSDQLINKEKNIALLKHENELLKTKLERVTQKFRQQKHLSLNHQQQQQNQVILQQAQAVAVQQHKLHQTQPTQIVQSVVIKQEKTDDVVKTENIYAINPSVAVVNNNNNNNLNNNNSSSSSSNNSNNIISSDNIIISSPHPTTTTATTKLIPSDPNSSSVIGENNGQFINKIVLQRKILKAIAASSPRSDGIAMLDSVVNELQKPKLETQYYQYQASAVVKKLLQDHIKSNSCDKDSNLVLNDVGSISSKHDNTTLNVDEPIAMRSDGGANGGGGGETAAVSLGLVENDDAAESLISTIVIENNDIKLEEDDDEEEQSNSPCDINNIIEIDDNDDESVCEENEMVSSPKKRKRILSEPTSTTSSLSQYNEKRQLYYYRGISMITDKDYITRDWQTDEIENELKQINENLLLEVPSWTVKECAGCYTIEGTEDLSEEAFLKRHSKYEIDERRRKKWDVQRIREQRIIERLKRRHCKRELMEENEEIKKKENSFTSFYPAIDNIKYIEVTSELPVQAFGENIPKIPIQTEFTLPWLAYLSNTNAAAAATAAGTSSSTNYNCGSSHSNDHHHNHHTNIKLADNSGMEFIKSRNNPMNKRKFSKALSFNSFQKGG